MRLFQPKEVLTAPELIRIRKLYLEKRYKQCIAACDHHANTELHPVHRVFLLFQQAICYEALGLAAHKYSKNKIPFFESAEDKFRAAIDILPQPFAMAASGVYNTPEASPLQAEFEPLKDTPTPYLSLPEQASDASSDYDGISSSGDEKPDFAAGHNRDRPRSSLLAVPRRLPRTTTFPDVDKQDAGILSSSEDEEERHLEANDLTPKKMARLSASLSSTHILAPKLVPSPLFSRTKKHAHIKPILLPVPAASTLSSGLYHIPDAVYTHIPYAPPATFRKSAIQTLISRFENTLPSPTTSLPPHTPLSAYTDISVPLTPPPDPLESQKTPATSRFAMIHSTFQPSKTHTQLHALPSTTVDLAHYNVALSSLRTTLLAAIATTSTNIAAATGIQEAHAEEKRQAFLASTRRNGEEETGRTRMASYWLFKTPSSARTENARLVGRDIDARNESDKIGIDNKKERIEKLRRQQFRVTKEKVGWKGSAYYEQLRRDAERELRMG